MYVAVKGGEKAIDNAHEILEEDRRGDLELPEIGVGQISEQLGRAVDRLGAQIGHAGEDLGQQLDDRREVAEVPVVVLALRRCRIPAPLLRPTLVHPQKHVCPVT